MTRNEDDLGPLELALSPWTRELLQCLTPRRRQAFVLRASGLTFDEIGDRLEISASRARQLHDAAVGVLTDAARRGCLLVLHVPQVVAHHTSDLRCGAPDAMRGALELPISTLGLGIRAERCFETAGIRRVGDLVCRTEGDVLRIANLGRKTLREIRNALAALGLHLDMDLTG